MRVFCVIFISFLFLINISGQDVTVDREPKSKTSLDGFAETEWGMGYEVVRQKFISLSTNPQAAEKVELVYEKKDELLLVRRNGIDYLYRFYKTPDLNKQARPKNVPEKKEEMDPLTGEPKHTDSGSLFSVGVFFNYLPSTELREKLEGKYGKPKKETLDDSKVAGAAIWELVQSQKDTPTKGGYIVMWRDSFIKKPFSRRIDYFSATLKEMIDKEYKEYFSVPELKTLRDLIQ